MRNLALQRPASQSSTSPWSSSQIPEEDARGGNDGLISRDPGFHTGSEQDPWWQVDLGNEFLIQTVLIFNRHVHADRLVHLSLLKSLDGKTWIEFHRKRDDKVFGAADLLPYVAEITTPHLARFVRIRLDGFGCLHFSECEVFGTVPDAKSRLRLIADYESAEADRRMVPPGRNGDLLPIDGFTIFADRENYSPDILSAIGNGSYESPERNMVKALVRSGDRAIEVGTAIGVVAMTLASIVGAASVLTFDANLEIAADAQDNFRRNGLGAVKSRVGILKNRQAIPGHPGTVDFYVSKAFWASRLNASEFDPDILRKVQVPIFCLEDEIAAHGANVLVCDIEGGEVDLLSQADLTGIQTIIMETHYWSAGKDPTDAMVRKLILDGFSLDLDHVGHHKVVFRR